ncbi:MAG TPA: 6-carboxytetrahydropterin synthase [Thermodesulfobacteriota bacterium]
MSKEICALTKVYHFSAAHRLNAKRYSPEENRRIFGKCNNPKGHGHDYYIEVKITGDIDPETGMLMDLSELDETMKEVIDELDHTRLDIEIPYFKEFVPSGENIVKYIWIKLKPKISKGNLLQLKLWETQDNYFEYFEEGR